MTRPPNPQLVSTLLAITTELIAAKGAEHVTLREIAEKAGVTPTTIHYYFADRHGLFEAAKLRAIADLDTAIAMALSSAPPAAAAQLRALAAAFVDWSLSHPHEFALIFAALPAFVDLTEELTQQYYASFIRLRGVIVRGRDAGELAVEDADAQATVAFATVFGIVDLYLNKRLPPQFWADITPIRERALHDLLTVLTPATTPPAAGDTQSGRESETPSGPP